MIEFLEYDEYVKELEAVKKKNEYVVCELIYGTIFEEDKIINGVKYTLKGVKNQWQKKVYKLSINDSTVGFDKLVEFLTNNDMINMIPTIIDDKARLSRSIAKKWNTFVALSRDDDGLKDKIYATVEKPYGRNELPDYMESLIMQAIDVDSNVDFAELSLSILAYCVSEKLIRQKESSKYYNRIIEEASEYAKRIKGN